ncbi:MAG: hypothetical protein AB7Q01_08630 [Gammaproteobacteria bacterium]
MNKNNIVAAVLGLVLGATAMLVMNNSTQVTVVVPQTPAEPAVAAAHPDRDASASPVSPVVSTSFDADVVAQIVANAERLGLPPRLLLALAAHEGGLVRALWPSAIGDRDLDWRGSCGPFQIYVAVHGQYCEYWMDADRSVRQMEDRWLWAFDVTGGWPAWNADNNAFLRGFAPRAQGSINWTYQHAVDALWVADRAFAAYSPVPACRTEQLAASLDESAFLAGVAFDLSAGDPVGSAYADLAARATFNRWLALQSC